MRGGADNLLGAIKITRGGGERVKYVRVKLFVRDRDSRPRRASGVVFPRYDGSGMANSRNVESHERFNYYGYRSRHNASPRLRHVRCKHRPVTLYDRRRCEVKFALMRPMSGLTKSALRRQVDVDPLLSARSARKSIGLQPPIEFSIVTDGSDLDNSTLLPTAAIARSCAAPPSVFRSSRHSFETVIRGVHS